VITHLRVMGTVYDVEVKPNLAADDGHWGETLQRNHSVRVDPDSDQPTVLVHETIHTIEQALNIEPIDEEHVHAIARGWVCILGDNPDMVVWLVQELFKDDQVTLKEVAAQLLEEAT